MAYVSSQEYSPVPAEAVVTVNGPEQPSAELTHRIRVSSRVVAFFCFIQLVLASLGLFTTGNIFMFAVTAIFVSLGLAGVIKRRPRLLVAHFVYSIIVYILTLIAMVYVILYCDDCGWVIYAVIGLYVLIQAIGLKHSRLLIWAINTANGTSCCGGSRSCARETVIIQEVAAPAPVASAPAPAQTQSVVQQSAAGTQSSTISSNVPMASAPVMMYPTLPNFSQGFPMNSMQMQPYPYQPYPYPMMGQYAPQQQPAAFRQQQ